MARHAVIDHQRRRAAFGGARQAASVDDLQEVLAATSPDPLGTLIRDEEVRAVRAWIGRQDEATRDLLDLRFGQGLTSREIAQMMGLSQDAVKKRCERRAAADAAGTSDGTNDDRQRRCAMHDRRMKATIRRGLEAADTPQPAPGHRGRLEADLLEAYRERLPRHRRFLMLLNPWNRAARLAMAGLAVALLGLGACSTSTTTEVEMGQKLTITMGGLSGEKADDDLKALEGELNRFFEAQPEVEGVTFNLRGMDGQTRCSKSWPGARAWTPRHWKPTCASRCRAWRVRNVVVEPLNGSVRENILSHLGHEYLGLELEVTGETAEEIRQQIMAQMATAGVTGDARVHVETSADGHKVIKVEVEGEKQP
jgi:hypothetical protein